MVLHPGDLGLKGPVIKEIPGRDDGEVVGGGDIHRAAVGGGFQDVHDLRGNRLIQPGGHRIAQPLGPIGLHPEGAGQLGQAAGHQPGAHHIRRLRHIVPRGQNVHLGLRHHLVQPLGDLQFEHGVLVEVLKSPHRQGVVLGRVQAPRIGGLLPNRVLVDHTAHVMQPAAKRVADPVGPIYLHPEGPLKPRQAAGHQARPQHVRRLRHVVPRGQNVHLGLRHFLIPPIRDLQLEGDVFISILHRTDRQGIILR